MTKKRLSAQCSSCLCDIPVRPNVKYCSPCRIKVRAVLDAEINERKKINQRSAKLSPAVTTKRETPKKKMTDAEQLELNRKIDSKYDVPCESKIYKPGSEDFLKVVQEMTGNRRIYGQLPTKRQNFSFLPSAARQYVTA